MVRSIDQMISTDLSHQYQFYVANLPPGRAVVSSAEEEVKAYEDERPNYNFSLLYDINVRGIEIMSTLYKYRSTILRFFLYFILSEDAVYNKAKLIFCTNFLYRDHCGLSIKIIVYCGIFISFTLVVLELNFKGRVVTSSP